MSPPLYIPQPVAHCQAPQDYPFFRRTVLFGLVACAGMLLIPDHSPEDSANLSGADHGYWGPVSATIDWCESNYAQSYYIAEYYNTLSNLGYIILAILGILLNPGLEKRYILAYLSIAVIGVGSMMFHGTLLFGAQLCDELPMLYLFCVVFYVCKEHSTPESTHPWLPSGLAIGAALFTIAYSLYPIPAVFQVGWGMFVTYTFWVSSAFIKLIPPADRKIGELSVYLMMGSLAVWAFEQVRCTGFTQALKLHSIWHLGTAAAAYIMVTSLWYYRRKYVHEHKSTHWDWYLGVLPRVLSAKDLQHCE